MYKKTLFCFANSWKRGGTCVAGKELAAAAIGGWVRPISQRPTHEISLPERRCTDGTFADVLDVVEVSLTTHSPWMYQTENHLIDATQRWKKSSRVTWSQVLASLDTVPGALWVNGHSTHHGSNDKIPVALVTGIGDSLKLIQVTELTLHVAYEAGFEGATGKRKVRGSFTLNGHYYLLAVTDPLVSQTYLQKGDGDYAIGPAALCVSLAEPIHGHAFKLIAAVFTTHRCAGS